jgi:hypothetical protein
MTRERPRNHRLAEREARAQAARDAGRDYHGHNDEALMTEVHRHAAKLYQSKEDALAFAEGFTEARRQRDEYLRERRGAP